MPQPVTPRHVVLNLVRTARQRSASIRQLIKVCSLFAFTPNAVRVAVARLVADELLESDERGSYRLGQAAAATHAHVEAWRSGEARVRPWKGEWLAIALPQKPERSTRRLSLRALSRLGLREGLPQMWVRPDNLREPLDATRERLRSLGLEEQAEVFCARDFGESLTQRFRTELWPKRNLIRSYESTLRDLTRSLEQLPRMPHETALVQSFLLGGGAIRVLATDPLLPEQILSAEPRAKLTATMLRYDAVGRALWRDFAAEPELVLFHGGRHAG